MELDLQKIRRQRNLPSLLRENYSSLNLHLPDNNYNNLFIIIINSICFRIINININKIKYLIINEIDYFTFSVTVNFTILS